MKTACLVMAGYVEFDESIYKLNLTWQGGMFSCWEKNCFVIIKTNEGGSCLISL